MDMDESTVQAVKQRPDILDAEATSWVTARIEVKPNVWMQILLFVVKDFNAMRIDTFLPESGAWPPPPETILLEREALKLINAKVGDVFNVQTPNGAQHAIGDVGRSGIVEELASARFGVHFVYSGQR